ncbi:uncharacterized protein LOC116618185 [Nematostella vectensis]|uniref:uncharacterized protein LOC116618185 n=1 Tax=Nematostella vectensis TaxID=45351 RepID=UPI00139019AF|nr:uncharacterized protein LOC116618185 [Nematostella vectensis]
MAAENLQLEAAFLAFNAEFARNGFGQAPAGLLGILRHFRLREGEKANEGRARLYKRLWCLLWFGSKKTLGAGLPRWPTYVYPESLKAIVRLIVPGSVQDFEDPDHDSVYKINIAILAEAKWPKTK